MKNIDEYLKRLIRVLLEVDLRLKISLSKATFKLILHPDGHVPDTLTRIRVIKGVSVVGQGSKVERHPKGNSILVVYVKFLPDSRLSEYENVYELSKKIKKLPGIEIVRVISINNRRVIHKGKPIVI
jgi:hypothetical protein